MELESWLRWFRQLPPHLLRDQEALEHIICLSGLCGEKLGEYPPSLWKYTGGLNIWQYPSELASYLIFLTTQAQISSYCEIGAKHGGTWIFTTEYLRRFFDLQTSVALDIVPSSTCAEYSLLNQRAAFRLLPSSSLKGEQFDLILIDGDHSAVAVQADYDNAIAAGDKLIAFHDIVSEAVPGVPHVWKEIATGSKHTFVQQQLLPRRYFGIGLLIL